MIWEFDNFVEGFEVVVVLEGGVLAAVVLGTEFVLFFNL